MATFTGAGGAVLAEQHELRLPRIFRFGYGLALYVQYAVAKVAQFTKQTSAESRGATFTAKDGVNMQYGHVAGALCAVLLALLVMGAEPGVRCAVAFGKFCFGRAWSDARRNKFNYTPSWSRL